jgi:hypothetical protein
LLRNALPGNGLRENPSNPKGGDFASFQRLGSLANRTTIGCTPQTFEILRNRR